MTTKKNPRTDERTRIDKTNSRQPRDGADHDRKEQDGTTFTAKERAEMLRNEFAQEALPSPPKLPGWHLCWLSTTNSYDPIHKRIRVGYQPVKASELVGFDEYNVREGEWAGCVSCNEMVLFKIPEDVYQEIMKLFHHDMPMEEEAKIKEKLKGLESGETEATLEEGFKDLAVRRQGKF